MEPKVVCGRTAPTLAPEARTWLRDRMETLWSRAERVEVFHKPPPPSRRDENHVPYLGYFERPLVAAVLPGGVVPFADKSGKALDFYHGRLDLDGLGDPRLEPLWRTCLEHAPAIASFSFYANESKIFDLFLVSVNCDVEAKRDFRRILFQHSPNPETPDALRRVLTELELTKYAESSALVPRKPSYKGESFVVELRDVPMDAETPRRLAEQLAAVDGLAPKGFDGFTINVGDRLPRYTAFRGPINAIARGWGYHIGAWYAPRFDPFVSPPPPPPGDEYRYPALARRRRGSDGRDRVIQVDIVHAAVGSYLEFLSHYGEKRLNKYADLADVELEVWHGPPADRWGD